MSDTVNTASCLCGKVSLEVRNAEPNVICCHCDICRKSYGGPALEIDAGADVTIKGTEHLSLYASSEWAERGFCKHCGTSLFCRLVENPRYFIPSELFDRKDNFVFNHQIFIDKKPSYYDFGNKTENLTAAEFWEKVSKEG